MAPDAPAGSPVLSLTEVVPGVIVPPATEPISNVSPSPTIRLLTEGEEQALESHEVIELQTFSERKAWIEEKIKVDLHLIHLATHLTAYSSSRKCLQSRFSLVWMLFVSLRS